ncbi:MAG: glycosyltransferase family 4 protein [bacterium]
MKKTVGKTKILFAITKSNWGGAQRYVFDLATSLPRDQFEVVVLTGREGELSKRLKEQNIRTVEIKNIEREVNPIKDLLVVNSFRRILNKEKPDIVHLNSSKMAVYGALATLGKKNIKTVFTSHGWPFNEKRSILSRIFYRISLQFALNEIDKTIFVSQNTAEQAFAMKLLKPEQAQVIHNGLSPIDFESRASARKIIKDLLPELEIHKNTLWLGTIAELHKNKGLGHAIHAISLLNNPNLKYFIIGGGELEQGLRKEIMELELTNKVYLLGKIANAATLLPAFDVFLLPSITESLPYVILEAGTAGLPVVASNVGGIPEIIESGVTGLLVRGGRSKEISHALHEMIEKGPAKQDYGLNLQKKISQKFNLHNMIEQTISVYQNILL